MTDSKTNWREVVDKHPIGSFKGRKTIHIVDHTLHGELCICLGRNTRYSPIETWTVDQFEEWCDKYKAKRVKGIKDE